MPNLEPNHNPPSLFWKHVFMRDSRRFYAAFTSLEVAVDPKIKKQVGKVFTRRHIADLAGPEKKSSVQKAAIRTRKEQQKKNKRKKKNK